MSWRLAKFVAEFVWQKRRRQTSVQREKMKGAECCAISPVQQNVGPGKQGQKEEEISFKNSPSFLGHRRAPTRAKNIVTCITSAFDFTMKLLLFF